ncbi:TlpA family protein disulfide reductase [Pseudomonadota bacterium]
MAQKMIYNAPRFKGKQYDWDVFVGPAAGEPVKDYTFIDFDGKEVKLSDYKGKWLVLETGSATCSMYSKNIPDMTEVMKEFPDVVFLLVYVREAHPGERLHQHRSFEEKMEAAKLLNPRYGEPRKILVDTLDGKYHLSHAAMPNTMYIIRPDGIVHYRCNWTTVDGVREALSDREKFHTQENADVKSLKASRGLYTTLRTMWTGGFVALWDFVKAAPLLAKRHKLVDDYYKEHGKFKQVPSK